MSNILGKQHNVLELFSNSVTDAVAGNELGQTTLKTMLAEVHICVSAI